MCPAVVPRQSQASSAILSPQQLPSVFVQVEATYSLGPERDSDSQSRRRTGQRSNHRNRGPGLWVGARERSRLG